MLKNTVEMCLKKMIHQTDSKNEWMLLSACFLTKFELVFVSMFLCDNQHIIMHIIVNQVSDKILKFSFKRRPEILVSAHFLWTLMYILCYSRKTGFLTVLVDHAM